MALLEKGPKNKYHSLYGVTSTIIISHGGTLLIEAGFLLECYKTFTSGTCVQKWQELCMPLCSAPLGAIYLKLLLARMKS